MYRIWLKLAKWFWRSIYFNFVIFFPISLLSPLGKGIDSLFFFLKLNLLYSRTFCAKFGWTWSTGSWEDGFQKLSIYFYYLPIMSPWERRGPSFIQTWVPFTQGCYLSSLLKLTNRFWRKRWKYESL